MSFFFSSSGALSLVSLHGSSLLAYLKNQVHAVWRKKRIAVPQNPDQSNTKKPHTTQSPQKKGKHAHQSQQAPHAHAHKNQAHNQTSPRASLKDPTKTTHHNSPLSKDLKGLPRNKTLTSFFDCLRFVLFFLLLSLPRFTLFLHFSRLLPFFLLYLSRLPLATAPEVFLMHSPVFSCRITHFIRQLSSFFHDFLLCRKPPLSQVRFFLCGDSVPWG